MEVTSTKEKITVFLIDFARGVLYFIAVCMLLWLNRYAASRGYHLYADASAPKLVLIRVVMLAGTIAASVGLGIVVDKFVQQREKWERIVLAVCCVLFWGICTWWVYAVPYDVAGDQAIVWYNTVLALDRNYSMQSFGGQMYIYPQQLGLSFLYEILFRITGSTDYHIIGYVNAALAPWTLLCGYLCVKECSDTRSALRFLPFMMLCLPYIIYSPYVYGDIPAICYTFILLWAVLRFIKDGRIRYGALACLMAVLGLLSRKNIWIFFIGLTIGLVCYALQKWNWKPVVLAACVLTTAFLGSIGVQYFNSYRSGYPVSEGMPSVLWMAMGLQYSEAGAGQYNDYSKQVYMEVGFDREAASAIGLQEIREQVHLFVIEPLYAKYFFHGKLYDQWITPLFESIKFTGSFTDKAEAELGGVVYQVYRGDGKRVVERFAAHMMFLVYSFALVGVIIRFYQKKSILHDIPLIVFVGGFLFSIIWEAKARYMLPYYVLLQMYAAYGLTEVSKLVAVLFQGGKAILEKKECCSNEHSVEENQGQ